MARFNAHRSARILWNRTSDSSLDRETEDNGSVVQDQSWASVFRARHCDVDFTVIAGSRENFLSGESDPEGKRPSQLGLKKKYRFDAFFLIFYLMPSLLLFPAAKKFKINFLLFF